MSMEDNRFFRVFYCDFIRDVNINSLQAEPLAADRLVNLAEHLLVSEDNYLGIIDEQETILQLYLSGKQMIMELIYPDSEGLYQQSFSIDDALAKLAELPDRFEPSLLPEAVYITP